MCCEARWRQSTRADWRLIAAALADQEIHLTYWGQPVAITCADFIARRLVDGSECSVYDTGMLLYYLREADGTPMADQWIGYRELPGGNFYSQAFQGYTGDRLGRTYGERRSLHAGGREIDGVRLTALPGVAYAYLLTGIRLASILYRAMRIPARCAVLFDAAASHYMTTDGSGWRVWWGLIWG
jgi:hypothetical protein